MSTSEQEDSSKSKTLETGVQARSAFDKINPLRQWETRPGRDPRVLNHPDFANVILLDLDVIISELTCERNFNKPQHYDHK